MSDRIEREAVAFTNAGYPELGEALRGLTPLAERLGVPRELPSDENTLQDVIHEYNTSLHTPELIDRTFQAAWRAWGEPLGYRFDVPACDRTEEEIAALEAEGRGILLIPDEIYTREGLVKLGMMFPKMQNRYLSEDSKHHHGREDFSNGGGCIDIEMAVDVPPKFVPWESNHLRIEEFLEERRAVRLETYVVGSQFSKLTSGMNFDQTVYKEFPPYYPRTIVEYNGNYSAHFSPNGSLYLGYIARDYDSDPPIFKGIRSEGVKQIS